MVPDAKAAADKARATAKAIASKTAAAAPKVPDPVAAAVATGKLVRARLGIRAKTPREERGQATSPRGPPMAMAAYSIPEFCVAHGISQAKYFQLKARGEGPREMHVGSRRLISLESAAAWRRAREAIA